MKKYQNFLSEKFQFLVMRVSIYLNRCVFVMVIIKDLTALVGQLSQSVDWENVLNGNVRLFHLTLNFV